jgi:hypothetical protein
MGIVGLLLSGPVSQFQQLALERQFPGISAMAIAKKVCGSAFTSLPSLPLWEH